MKRQADGQSVETSEEVEQKEINGSKRIKLVNNESDCENMQINGSEEKPEKAIVMDDLVNESIHNLNYEEPAPPLLNNGSTAEHSDSLFDKIISENHSFPNENEQMNDENLNSIAKSNCNGSHNEGNVQHSENNSGFVPELQNEKTSENSIHADENKTPISNELEPPVLKHCDHDVHYGESTDSFQSEGFEANNSAKETNDVPEKGTSQQGNDLQQNSDLGKEFPNEHFLKEHIIDVDNIPLSYLKVSELVGHSDVVFSVAADEDYILSACADTTVKVWHMERQSNISTFSGHSDTVTSLLLLTPNQSKVLKKKMSLTKVSRIAVTGSLDCHIKLWSVLEGKELSSVYTFNGISCLGYLESECLVVVGTEGGKLEVWNLSEKKAVISVNAHKDAVTDIKVKDNFIYSVSVDGTVKVWCYEDEDICPVYARTRKEISPDKTKFRLAQWKTVALSSNVLYLGDNTNSIKVLDWNAGRLSLFKNQPEVTGTCDCVVADKNMLFSTYYDSASDTGGINVWKLPEMSYICTISGPMQYIASLAVVEKNNKLNVIAGGHKLSVFEFDFSKSASSDGAFFVHELEAIGHEINEKTVDVKSHENKRINTSTSEDSSNRWCQIM